MFATLTRDQGFHIKIYDRLVERSVNGFLCLCKFFRTLDGIDLIVQLKRKTPSLINIRVYFYITSLTHRRYIQCVREKTAHFE